MHSHRVSHGTGLSHRLSHRASLRLSHRLSHGTGLSHRLSHGTGLSHRLSHRASLRLSHRLSHSTGLLWVYAPLSLLIVPGPSARSPQASAPFQLGLAASACMCVSSEHLARRKSPTYPVPLPQNPFWINHMALSSIGINNSNSISPTLTHSISRTHPRA